MFYVYTLTDPRSGAVFYVGKGSRHRMHQHPADVKNGRAKYNIGKNHLIREILDAGLYPVATKVASFENEPDALAYERELIATTEGLTNILAGGSGWSLPPEERARRERKRKKRLGAYKYWKNMVYFRGMLEVVDRWPGVTFPGVEDGDRKAEELVAYIRQRVRNWEALKVSLRQNQLAVA